MELGSKQHKQLLLKGILRTAFRTSLLGLAVGLFFMIPLLVKVNPFSANLAYLGGAIILISLSYSAWIAVQKYQKVIKPFNETYRK
ncbi:MAG: hypothetical protein ISEC1_P0365 [Thiomicrorhabdus sp.]|nr:MAG: hypothetical protein ISEC1_P0365 [Thiomicrorhabdus sp.]